jgi:hypothetical protein
MIWSEVDHYSGLIKVLSIWYPPKNAQNFIQRTFLPFDVCCDNKIMENHIPYHFHKKNGVL